MKSVWLKDSTQNGNLRGMRMNGVGTGIGASTPAVVGYLGKVSYAQYSPSVTRAKLHSNLVCIVWKLYRIDPPPQTRKKHGNLCVKGERILIKAVVYCTLIVYNCYGSCVFCV